MMNKMSTFKIKTGPKGAGIRMRRVRGVGGVQGWALHKAVNSRGTKSFVVGHPGDQLTQGPPRKHRPP